MCMVKADWLLSIAVARKKAKNHAPKKAKASTIQHEHAMHAWGAGHCNSVDRSPVMVMATCEGRARAYDMCLKGGKGETG